MELQRILVGIDFSEEADTARMQALNIAALTGAEVILYHVVVPPELWGDTAVLNVYGGIETEKIVHAEIDTARRRLEEMASQPIDGVSITTRVDTGHADVLLAETAAELGVQLVVVGTHGRTGFRRLTLGSVAEQALRRCETDVLVARRPSSGAGGYNHILVPTDFTLLSERALTMATGLVAAGGVIDLAHYWQTSFAAHGYYTTYEPAEVYTKRISASVAERGYEWLEKFRPRHDKLNFIQGQSAPPKGILERLDSTAYDLVVMGSHGRRGLRRWLLGSVAENVVRHAPCSVLVTH